MCPFIAIQAWHVWITLGIIFVIIEIFDPAFFFIALGIGAIATGLLSLLPLLNTNVPLQIVIFALLSFITFLFTRKLAKKVNRRETDETNVYALKGQVGRVTKQIPVDGKGYVKVGSEEWSAISQDGSAIELDETVKVLDIEGNKLIVEKEQ